jgi:YtxH-like protein
MTSMTKIADTLADSLPTREAVINAIGLASRRSTSAELASMISIFGAGLLVGAGLALLFAPKTGEELRRDLGDRLGVAQDARERGEATGAASA